MADYFKELFEAWGDRIRSPILGSVLLAFAAANWKVLFFLFFAEKSVLERIEYFENNTDFGTLVLAPVVFGFLIALGSPWLKLLGAKLAATPSGNLSKLQDAEASRRRIERLENAAKEEAAKANLEREAGERTLDSLRQTDEAKEISEEAAEQVKDARERAVTSVEEDKQREAGLSPLEKQILVELSSGVMTRLQIEINKGVLKVLEADVSEFSGHRIGVEVEAALNALEQQGLVTSEKEFGDGERYFSLTMQGYKAYDKIVAF